MTNEFLLKQNTALNELHFELAAAMCENNIKCLYEKLIKSGLDDHTLGFWIWDISGGLEIYSPKFRASLQFEGEHDFPNVPESWQKYIEQDSLDLALMNFDKHVDTKGEFRYVQQVIYRRKISGKVTLVCHGKVISWNDDDSPKIMVGVHMLPSGRYISNLL